MKNNKIHDPMHIPLDHPENALFDYYSDQDTHVYLWEMYQYWMLELSQRDQTHLDVSNRQYFFELMASHIHQDSISFRSSFQKQDCPHSITPKSQSQESSTKNN
ncbi:hypothetical protein V8V91_23455 [Algoriphagus halophilus]|uniref:hypothetical protein n=1 Tax=Algoriphagus halophilus TaxID=226505 RepID=UPI00358E1A9E